MINRTTFEKLYSLSAANSAETAQQITGRQWFGSEMSISDGVGKGLQNG